MRLLARCSVAAERQRTPLLLALLATIVLAVAIPDLRPAGGAALVLVAALLVAVLPHELAHAAVARACGLRVRRLAAGFGPRVGGVIVRGVHLELRLIPAGGFADIEALDAAPRRARIATTIAGPLVNLVLVPFLLVGATLAAGAPSIAVAIDGAAAIGRLLVEGSGTLITTYAADPGNLAALPIGGLPSTAAAAVFVSSGGLPMLLVLAACLSAGVGLINLLPWPPLDGAHVAAALTNRVPGKKAALAVDALLAIVLMMNLVDLLRVAGLFGGATPWR